GSWIIAVQLEKEDGVFALTCAIALPKIELIHRRRGGSKINHRNIGGLNFGQVKGEFACQTVMAGDDKNGFAFGQQLAPGAVGNLSDLSPTPGAMQRVLIDWQQMSREFPEHQCVMADEHEREADGHTHDKSHLDRLQPRPPSGVPVTDHEAK